MTVPSGGGGGGGGEGGGGGGGGGGRGAARRGEDGVVGPRAQRDLGRALGGRLRPPRLAEDAGEDAQAHRALVRLAVRRAVREQRAQRAQRGGLVLVAPQRLEVLGVRLERRVHGLGREGEHRLGEREAHAAREGHVGQERRG